MPSQNPLIWRGLVETSGFYALEDLNLLGNFDPENGQLFEKPSSEPAIEAARRNAAFETFLEFSQFPLWRVIPEVQPANAQKVELLDLRFGTPAEPGFMVSASIDARGGISEPAFQFGTLRPR
jgi:hypothetical protein